MNPTWQGWTEDQWWENGKNPGVCQRCDGCKEIADTDEGEAWWVWKTLPLVSQFAVTIGAVKPIPCPDCGGTGKAS